MAGMDAGSDGGLLGVPVADTMKRVAADGRVTATVDRGGLWHALTPQMFRLEPLRAALRQAIAANSLVTDEASAMEQAGYRPQMVQGHRDNIKITLPADLALAAFYLQAGER
jgi:2-C-methyl-D-erythritol 4-phosphate cytidylyltransferase